MLQATVVPWPGHCSSRRRPGGPCGTLLVYTLQERVLQDTLLEGTLLEGTLQEGSLLAIA